MPMLLTCPRGHQWESSAEGANSPGPAICPQCGAAVVLSGAETVSYQEAPPAACVQPETQSPLQVTTGVAPSAAPTGWPTIEGYAIVGELGRGGMGVVYKARQQGLNRIVALKMILSGSHAGPDELARFRTEAEAVARLQHPNMVQIYEVGEAEGRPYFSLEFAEGGSLEDRLKGRPLPEEEAAALVETLARAMHHAHQRGIIHRDLKPANVLLAVDGLLKITDFGLAKSVEEFASETVPAPRGTGAVSGALGVTQPGAIQGTPSYMAPEQAIPATGRRATAITPAIDVYALGAILFELLTGRPPFRAANVLDTLEQVRTREPVPPSRLQPAVSLDLDTICLKCLKKEPRRRYPTSLALADDLRRFLNHEAILARPTPWLERVFKWAKRRPSSAALLAVCVLVLIGAAYGIRTYRARLRASHAADLVRTLESADSARVPRLIAELAEYPSESGSLLRATADDPDSEPERRLRANLALVADEPARVHYLAQRLLDCSVSEFPVVRDALQPFHAPLLSTLLEVLHDRRQAARARFHAGMALAFYAPTEVSWTDADALFLSEQLLQANRDYQREVRANLQPIAERLLGPLQARFHDEGERGTIRVAAADALADFAQDRPELLARLACEAGAEQHGVLRAALVEAPEGRAKARQTLRDLLRELSTPEMSEKQRVQLGRRRAGAAITLRHLGDHEASARILLPDNDPEALTQFIHRLKDRGVGPRELVEDLERAGASPARFALLLALGDFRLDEVPAEKREKLKETLLAWYRHDPSSGIHGAAGWLLRTWGWHDEAAQVERTPLPYDPTGKRDWFVQTIGTEHITFIVMPPGSFLMGSPSTEAYRQKNERLHRVELTRPFAIADREVTRGQFERYLQATGVTHDFDDSCPTPSHPVARVNWFDAVSYCRWLTAQAGLGDAEQAHDDAKRAQGYYPERQGFRLPTEAEWEYACRAGTTTAFSFGNDRELLGHYGRFLQGEADVGGRLRPNPRGLFDMHGNVWEWCNDWYQAHLDDAVDPRGPAGTMNRTLRGGGWDRSAWHCRSAYRHSPTPDYRGPYMGFRLVRTLK